jgi:uncharacterized protein with HEPN domain
MPLTLQRTLRFLVVAPSDADRKAALEVLRNAQFVYGLSRYPKKQVLDDPADVRALRTRLEAMREAAKRISPAQREKLDVPWDELEAIDTGTEAVWKAAKRATPKIIAQLTPLVRDEPEAAFLIAPIRGGRKSDIEPPPPKLMETRKEKPKAPSGLTGKEIAGLELVIQERAAADESYFVWLRGNHDLPLSEWRKRRAQAERARRAEVLYLEKLFKSRSLRP